MQHHYLIGNDLREKGLDLDLGKVMEKVMDWVLEMGLGKGLEMAMVMD